MARGGPRPGSGPKPLSTETHILQGTFRPYRHADSDADTAQVLKGHQKGTAPLHAASGYVAA
jgi:hypothetical protein